MGKLPAFMMKKHLIEALSWRKGVCVLCSALLCDEMYEVDLF